MFIHLYCLKTCAYKKLEKIYLNIYMYHGIENIHVIREKQRLSRTFNIFPFQQSLKFLKRFFLKDTVQMYG